MNTQDTLTKAMLNKQPISFQYSRLGRIDGEEIKNAHVIFISNKLGKKTLAANVAYEKTGAAGWRHFDLNSMCNVQILEERMVGVG
ncbi:MAG: hypothetical protein KA100_06300 [Rickettsiales bacterium]|nr:hypothetical protein [Rickettsiales bacterium]